MFIILAIMIRVIQIRINHESCSQIACSQSVRRDKVCTQIINTIERACVLKDNQKHEPQFDVKRKSKMFILIDGEFKREI